jgi:hypothetical protein
VARSIEHQHSARSFSDEATMVEVLWLSAESFFKTALA